MPLARTLQRGLYSDRPRWAMMPSYVADNFVDSLLFVLSFFEQCDIRYVAHYGTLLGAARLGGVAPWDEDADIYLLDCELEPLRERVEATFAAYGFELIWTAKRDALLVRQVPWLAGQGHIGLSVLPAALPDHEDPACMDWDAFMRRSELYPLCAQPFYSSYVLGPAQPDPVLERLYGASGSRATMQRFTAPPISAATRAFWAEARPRPGELNWSSIARRFTERAQRLPWHASTAPWWWFNGAYNLGVQAARRLGHAIARMPPVNPAPRGLARSRTPARRASRDCS
jgi:LicD family